ncbi:hypothetical protein [Micromonospora sp. NPDC048063]|uniref:hypothetical protein n=1 Tax=Micromonospora sp. NPDC048063 TaxID=3364256 RepID=UPI0037127DB8
MARLIGPDESVRLVYLPDGRARAQGLTATLYADQSGTMLADVLTEAGAPIAGSQVTIDAYSKLPLIQYPDGVDVVYATVNGGPLVPLYARLDDRVDQLGQTVAGVATDVADAATAATAATATAALTVFRSGSTLLVRSRFDSTRDILMPLHTGGGAESMVQLVHAGLASVALTERTTPDAQVWPTVAAPTTAIHDTSDDNCPLNVAWSYVGANHGYSAGSQVTRTGHGKTTADLGSQWSDGTRTYTLLQIVDANRLLFGNPYTVASGIVTGGSTAPATTLTHVSGAANTASVPITGGVAGLVQIHPSTYGQTVTVELDGKALPDGKAYGQVLTVTETYLVASYKGLIDAAQANVGTPVASIMSQVSPLARVSNTYRISPGQVVVAQRVSVLEKTYLGMGVTQAMALTVPAGGSLKQFMAGVGVAGGLSFSTLADLASMSGNIDVTSAAYLSPVAPAASMRQFAYNSGGAVQYGLAMGILPVADGHPTQRLKNAPAKSWFISAATKKNYPQVTWVKIANPGESYAGTAYRAYLAGPDTATELLVSDGTDTWAVIERTTTTSEGRVQAPQLLGRTLVSAGPATIAAADRVTGEGISYTASASPAYGVWRAAVDAPRLETIPGATSQVGSYFLVAQGAVATSALAGSFNILYLHPMYLPEAVLVDRACIEVTAVGTGVVRHGVYANDPATGLPAGAGPLADFGTADVTTTGIKESTLSPAVLLPAGWHWYGWVWQGVNTTGPTMRTLGTGVGFGPLNLGTSVSLMSGARLGYFVSSVAGPLGAITVAPASAHQLSAPRVAYRRA